MYQNTVNNGVAALCYVCSPLLHLLETLVRATANGNRDLVNDAPLLLLSIFRAIKKAEDVVDTQKTPVRNCVAQVFSCIHL